MNTVNVYLLMRRLVCSVKTLEVQIRQALPNSLLSSFIFSYQKSKMGQVSTRDFGNRLIFLNSLFQLCAMRPFF